MIIGTLSNAVDATGRHVITDIRSNVSLGVNDVQLVAMPMDFGPFVYDSPTKTAVLATYLQPRTFNAILADLNSLTVSQKLNVQNDFLVTNQFDQTADDAGIKLAAIIGRSTGLDATTVLRLKFFAVASYIRSVNTSYLVNPTFDPTINIPGMA